MFLGGLNCARRTNILVVTATSTSELRHALLASYPDAARFGAPIVASNRDDTAAAGSWLMGLLRKRSDGWPAIGIALQHAAQDGGDLARGALADLLESFQQTIVSAWPFTWAT